MNRRIGLRDGDGFQTVDLGETGRIAAEDWQAIRHGSRSDHAPERCGTCGNALTAVGESRRAVYCEARSMCSVGAVSAALGIYADLGRAEGYPTNKEESSRS